MPGTQTDEAVETVMCDIANSVTYFLMLQLKIQINVLVWRPMMVIYIAWKMKKIM